MTPLEIQALSLLSWLIKTFGAQLVMAVLGVMTGTTGGQIIEDVSAFVASVLSAVRSQIEDERLREILEAEYRAADAIAEAADLAKFGPKT